MIRGSAFGLLLCVVGCHSSPAAPVAPSAPGPAPAPAPGTTVASTTPTPGSDALRYRPPSCALRYEVRATLTPSPGGAPVETWTTFDATPTPSGVTIAGNARIFSPNGARIRAYPHQVPPRNPVAVAYGDGVHMTEQGGPSQLYNGIPQHTSGLSILFPDLPEASSPGSARDWKLDVPRSQDIDRAEHPNAGSGAPNSPMGAKLAAMLDEAPPVAPILAKVRLDNWSTIAGMRAATLSMEGTQQLASHMIHMTGGPETATRTVTPGSATLTGTYVVLASGRLLRATVDRASVIGSLPPIERAPNPYAPPTTSAQTEHIEVRLVTACDGPTEPPFDPKFSPREAATMAAGDFVVAWQKGARTEALSLTAPELRQSQGDDALWKKLATFIDVQGPIAVMPPQQLGPNDVKGDGDVIDVIVRGEPKTNHPPGQPMRITNYVSPTTLTMARRGDRFLVLKIHSERGAKMGATGTPPKEVLLDIR